MPRGADTRITCRHPGGAALHRPCSNWQSASPVGSCLARARHTEPSKRRNCPSITAAEPRWPTDSAPDTRTGNRAPDDIHETIIAGIHNDETVFAIMPNRRRRRYRKSSCCQHRPRPAGAAVAKSSGNFSGTCRQFFVERQRNTPIHTHSREKT